MPRAKGKQESKPASSAGNAGGAAAAVSLDLGDKLSGIRRQLQAKERSQAELCRDIADLKAEIAAVTRLGEEINQVASACRALESRKATLVAFAGKLKADVEKVVRERKGKIDKIIAQHEKRLADLHATVATLEKEFAGAETAYANVVCEARNQHGLLQGWREQKASLEAALAEAEKLRAQVEGEHRQMHPASVLFLLGELERVTEGLEIPAPDKLAAGGAELAEATRRLGGEVANAKARLDDARRRLETARKELRMAQASRRQAVIEQLGPLNESEPA